jgi:hypothetical protein
MRSRARLAANKAAILELEESEAVNCLLFEAIGATNRAILHSISEQDLYQRVCSAAVDSGNFLGTAIFRRP